jgi:thioredoxin-related protein
MKRFVIITVIALGFLSDALSQEQVKWYSIEEAVQLAQKEPRILVIDVYTDWCGWCKRLDATTFADPEVAAILNRNFYPVKLDAEGKKDIVIGKRTFKFVDNGHRGYHEVAAIVTNRRLVYPTISYLNEQGKVLKVAPGYLDASQFKIYLAWFTEGAYKTQEFDDFRAAHAATEGEP